MDVVQIVSMAGALLVLAGFWASQTRRLDTGRPLYLLINLCGAALLAVTATIAGVWSFVLLNVVWALVAGRSLLPFARRRRAAV